MKRRKEISVNGNWVPSLLTISPSMRCNLNCTGCYAGLYSKDGELSEQEIDGLLAQARDMGIFFVVVSGGESYHLRKTWIRLFKKYSDMYFLTYTNGTLINEQTAFALGKLGNVASAICVEGYKEETKTRRGKEVWVKIRFSILSPHRNREATAAIGLPTCGETIPYSWQTPGTTDQPPEAETPWPAAAYQRSCHSATCRSSRVERTRPAALRRRRRLKACIPA